VDGLYTAVIGEKESAFSPLTLKETLALSSPLYLQVTVGATTLSPREQLNAVPYAMDADTLDNLDSTQFITTSGGIITNAFNATVLTVLQSGSGSSSHAVQGVTLSSSSGAAGVYGIAVAPATGLPMEGEMGVRGESSTGAGVAGFSLEDVGVFGMSSNGVGIMGASFNSYGLHAVSLTTNAIYAEGSIKAEKLVYSSPRTSYYSVGAREFHTRGLEDFDNVMGMYLYDGVGTIYAPVHLPHGATIIDFAAQVYDSVATTGLVITLKRDAISGSGSDLAEVASSGSSGWQTINDTTISDAVVDNSNYFYYASSFSYVWASTNKWRAITITYTIDEAP